MTRFRRGTAPLEFVVVMPILVVLFTAILWAGAAGAARITALGDARVRAWSDGERAAPGDVLRLDHDPNVSAVEVRSEQKFRAPFAGSGVASATTGSQFRTWSHDDLPTESPLSDGGVPFSNLFRSLVERNPKAFSHSSGFVNEFH